MGISAAGSGGRSGGGCGGSWSAGPRRLQLVWVPGWATSPACFEPLQEALMGASLPFRLEHRNVRFASCREPAAFPAAVQAALAETDAALVVAVGWSLGALAVVQAAAAQGQGAAGSEASGRPAAGCLASRPDGRRLAGLVLLSGCARFTRPGRRMAGVPGGPGPAGPAPGGRSGPAPEITVGNAGWHPAVLRQMERALEREPDATLARFYRQLGEGGEPESFAWPERFADRGSWLQAGLRFLAGADVSEAARRVQLPALVVHGSADRVIPPAAGRELARLLPLGTFRLIAGAGHAVHVTRPREVAEAVAAFLASQSFWRL